MVFQTLSAGNRFRDLQGFVESLEFLLQPV